jgi:glycerate 2-kinase
MFEAAIAAAQPAHCVPRHLPAAPRGRLIVIGAGKASAAMARAVEENWQGELSGLVVTRYGYAVPCQRIEIVEAAHPVPDAAGSAAAQRIHALVSGTRRRRYRAVPDLGRRLVAAALPLARLMLADKQA